MDATLFARLHDLTRALLPELRDLRHAIHAEPELALEEAATRVKILRALEPAGLAIWKPLLGTDLIAELNGPEGAPTVVLRADMDALPLEERTGAPWASRRSGVMHACGHDGHSAALVGAARVLAQLRDHAANTVRFVFQPGEEVVAAGGDLVKRGACRGAEAAFALHGWPGLALGCVAAREGAMFAASDHFAITTIGLGGHGALPQKARNPISAAAEIAARLAALHEEVHAVDGSVVTVTAFNAGSNSNIIPSTAEMLGTMRFLLRERGVELELRVIDIIESVKKRWGVEVRFVNEHNYPLPVVNTSAGAVLVRRLATEYLHAFEAVDYPTMGAEDFAFFLQEREGAIFRLGLGEDSASVHSPTFDFNDGALENAVMMHCLIALEYRSRPASPVLS